MHKANLRYRYLWRGKARPEWCYEPLRLDPDEAEKLRGQREDIFRAVQIRRKRRPILQEPQVADIDKVAVFRPPPAEANIPPGGCGNDQRLFIRGDRLDTYPFRDSTFVTGFVSRTKAKGASASFTHDDIGQTDSLTVNGRLSYVIAKNDPLSPCFEGLSARGRTLSSKMRVLSWSSINFGLSIDRPYRTGRPPAR
jgi:hypothetical protein